MTPIAHSSTTLSAEESMSKSPQQVTTAEEVARESPIVIEVKEPIPYDEAGASATVSAEEEHSL